MADETSNYAKVIEERIRLNRDFKRAHGNHRAVIEIHRATRRTNALVTTVMLVGTAVLVPLSALLDSSALAYIGMGGLVYSAVIATGVAVQDFRALQRVGVESSEDPASK